MAKNNGASASAEAATLCADLPHIPAPQPGYAPYKGAAGDDRQPDKNCGPSWVNGEPYKPPCLHTGVQGLRQQRTRRWMRSKTVGRKISLKAVEINSQFGNWAARPGLRPIC